VQAAQSLEGRVVGMLGAERRWGMQDRSKHREYQLQYILLFFLINKETVSGKLIGII
jgi:hypothetical protein